MSGAKRILSNAGLTKYQNYNVAIDGLVDSHLDFVSLCATGSGFLERRSAGKSGELVAAQIVAVVQSVDEIAQVLPRIDNVSQPEDEVALLLHCELSGIEDDAVLQSLSDGTGFSQSQRSKYHAMQFPAHALAPICAALRVTCAQLSVIASCGILSSVIESYVRTAKTTPLLFLSRQKTWLVAR